MAFGDAISAKARVNITLDITTGDAQRNKELPLKLLMLGDYSHGDNVQPLRQRKRRLINKSNFDAILAECAPQLSVVVDNQIHSVRQQLAIHLQFNQRRDFEPAQICQQVPELKRLLAMRMVLKDLKANMMDNSELKQALEKIVKPDTTRLQLQHELSGLIPAANQESPS